MKKYIFTFMMMLAAHSVCNAQNINKESFVGTWEGDDMRMAFKMQGGDMWCYANVDGKEMSTDNIGLVEGSLYVDMIVEKRNGKEFSSDVAENTSKQKQDAILMAASVIAQPNTKPQTSESGEPSNIITRRLTLICTLNTGKLSVERSVMEEREGYGEVEYRYGPKVTCICIKK